MTYFNIAANCLFLVIIIGCLYFIWEAYQEVKKPDEMEWLPWDKNNPW